MVGRGHGRLRGLKYLDAWRQHISMDFPKGNNLACSNFASLSSIQCCCHWLKMGRLRHAVQNDLSLLYREFWTLFLSFVPHGYLTAETPFPVILHSLIAGKDQWLGLSSSRYWTIHMSHQTWLVAAWNLPTFSEVPYWALDYADGKDTAYQ